MTRPTRARLIALALVLPVLLATACSAAPSLSNLGSKPAAQQAPGAQPVPAAPPAAAPAAARAPARESAAGAPGAADNASSAAFDTSNAQTQAFDRMVIRTAQVALEVTDIEQSLASVRQIAQQGGGIVSASNTRVERTDDQERTIADITIQVRSDGFESALAALRGLGKVNTESSNSQDVTEEYVDLDSSLRNLQASEAAILRLMDRAQRIEDVVSLQRELTNIRGQIERIQGRKRYLERRTDMSTIAVSLRLPLPESARPISGGAWNPLAFAARGWQASLAVLRGIAEVFILVLSFSWWLIPLVAVGVYLFLQRRRGRAAPPPAAAVTPSS